MRTAKSLLVPVVVGVVGLAAISVGQDVPNRHSIEGDLRDRSLHALEGAGINGAQVRFVGRDGTVTVVSGADKERALRIVRGVNGVRVARVEGPAAVPETPPTAPPTATPTAPSTATPTASPTPAESPSPNPTESPSPSGPPVQDQLGALPPLTFENNSATLTAQGQAVVASAATILKAHPTVKIRIEGHTDSRGSDASNLALSQARAQAVLDALKAQGVTADRMTAVGFGERRPKVPDTSDANRAINRRVELVVVQP
jgi:outer membrane protein OmpA-like peptidoglycan-associated protein